ncbi:hypothetical protein M409DRAFT_71559 [Zasmidium cellare ATCC 36951]|uniref:AAA+ ATPase domain-containing protein n=1 Tax=Zasmidium cellare ATCC 36951 TaxID=1080233 RepID=A0A6A6BYM4_ZASCE|nr:uncharacterized protein M409DRAFT_71559 [Zasmidium cellare ATCC 36951]KAF2158619.1 hypothetical protein M409DRAFT_71559 [Zasmidium cellare ATCC 36951]
MGDYGDAGIDASNTVYGRYKAFCSAPRSEMEINVLEFIRSIHPDQHVTSVNRRYADLVTFANAGNAEAHLIRETNEVISSRMYAPPTTRMEGGDGKLGENVAFGLYNYTWKGNELQVYYVCLQTNCGQFQNYFILTPKDQMNGEEHSPIADELIKAAGTWSSQPHEEIYVFDGGNWQKNHKLWQSVQGSSWDDVILDPAMKDTLIKDVEGFFDSRQIYEEYSVPWKRGIILHGTPGCGKTISIKALMNSLQTRNVASMYVKSFEAQEGQQNSILTIFRLARNMAPCMLIFEDLDSLVTDKVRSYFLNEVDGLENNDGILMIGSTNHLERLDPGIAKRPSRFDRKYHYKLPGERERILYCEYWRKKLQKNSNVEFHEDISKVIAQLTEGFSFAYLKELFVQTLLALVGGRADVEDDDDDAVEGSARLVKEGESLESTEEKTGEKESPPSNKMPEVEIPDHLKENSLMRILHKQTKALWREMDNTDSDEIHGRAKIGGGVGKRVRRAVRN